jgi:hypothetical protein
LNSSSKVNCSCAVGRSKELSTSISSGYSCMGRRRSGQQHTAVWGAGVQDSNTQQCGARAFRTCTVHCWAHTFQDSYSALLGTHVSGQATMRCWVHVFRTCIVRHLQCAAGCMRSGHAQCNIYSALLGAYVSGQLQCAAGRTHFRTSYNALLGAHVSGELAVRCWAHTFQALLGAHVSGQLQCAAGAHTFRTATVNVHWTLQYALLLALLFRTLPQCTAISCWGTDDISTPMRESARTCFWVSLM